MYPAVVPPVQAKYSVDLAEVLRMADQQALIPHGCSFSEGRLLLNGKEVPFIHYRRQGKDEIWFPANPTMKVTGEKNITHILARVSNDCKMSLKDLVAAKGLPSDGCYGFVTTPNPEDYHEGKAIWVNESGFYAILLGSRKPECVRFQRWVLEEVLPSIRRTGGYLVPGRQSSDQDLRDWLTARLDALERMVGTSSSTAQVQHGVLEITRSRMTSFSQKLQTIGTPVDASQLEIVNAEGGALHVSVFLKDMDVRHDIIRRLNPTFALELGRRKLEQYNGVEGIKPPLWIAWSQGAWRLYYTEVDRELMYAVFEDPSTKQTIEILEKSCQTPRPDAPVIARRRSGPYSGVLRGGSSGVSSGSIQRFFGSSVV